MAKRKLPPEQAMDGFNMTPMIDIVFQLIIFFMLVTDMANAQLEPVVLPIASKAIKDKFVDPQVLVLNILKDGTIKNSGKILWAPKNGDNCDKLERIFQIRRQSKAYQEVPGDDKWVKYPILVRCDRTTAFEHVQKVLMIATHHGGVTRVQLGAKKEVE